MPNPTTQSESRVDGDGPNVTQPIPGALIVFSIEQPLFARLELPPGVPARWARYDLGGVRIEDTAISRDEHLEVRFSEGRFHLENRSSKGSRLNGVRFDGRLVAEPGSVLRLGKTLVLLLADVTPYTHPVEIEEASLGGGPPRPFVIGPRYREALDRIASARARRRNLVIEGETGTGKEFAANHYHRSAKNPGPFKRFNASQFTPDIAASEVNGIGDKIATDVKERKGQIFAANNGVLFLDEFAEMPLNAQQQFLRATEGEVAPIGDESGPRRVSVLYVCASHQNMLDRVKRGLFRQDLYYRFRQEEVSLLPLRKRLEEIPWVMHLDTEARGIGLHVSAVEFALRQQWEGNLRELRASTEEAIGRALEAKSDVLRAEHFQRPPSSGSAFAAPPVPPRPPPPADDPGGGSQPRAQARAKLSKDELVAALEANGWNLSRTASALGIFRTQLKRDMKRLGIEKPVSPGKTLADEDAEDSDDEG